MDFGGPPADDDDDAEDATHEKGLELLPGSEEDDERNVARVDHHL